MKTTKEIPWVAREIDKCVDLLLNTSCPLRDIERYHISQYCLSLQKLI